MDPFIEDCLEVPVLTVLENTLPVRFSWVDPTNEGRGFGEIEY
jgi:hypothetical protein